MKKTRFAVLFLLFLSLFTSTWASAANFSDLDTQPQKAIVSYAVEHGLFSGVSEESFSPNSPFTPAMAAAVFARLAKTAATNSPLLEGIPNDAYYAKPAAWCVENGIMPASAFLNPDAPLSGADLKNAFLNYITWLGRGGETPIEIESSELVVSRFQAASAFVKLEQYLSQRTTKLLEHTAMDGVSLTGKLDLPADGPLDRVVLFVNGSGPNTYDNHRSTGTVEFNYFDVFAEQLTMRGIGFFRWNTRGVTAGTQPPLYAEIDSEAYQTYVPQTSVSDIAEWISVLRQDERLKNAKIDLLGWSEGTIIAPLAAKNDPQEIDRLFLAGYCNDRMDEIFNWQQSGESSMIFYGQYFDANQDKKISQEEFDQDPYQIKAALGASFSEIDVNQDGFLTADDFALMLAPGKADFYNAVERGDDQWLASNYGVRLTSGWFKSHQDLLPNRDLLPHLDLPISIFHGTADQNCPVEGVRAIQQAFQAGGKQNLNIHIYDGFDHDLNYFNYIYTGQLPQSFEDLFQAIGAVD